ncbi:MAG: RdgB/HAM1 family non-canonical purine NTP pyrophosphatase [Elusimicrobiota bacterium]|jgi:XTP/dITP diphosphohydrolase|nr:RdgB/HAM1 family non-canonical purine NTP pyrophosphatase [Elusimicrobiota bacterium]
MNKKLIIGTGNIGKFLEISQFFEDLVLKKNLELMSLQAFSKIYNKKIVDVAEDGKTIEENAIKKAIGFFCQTNIATLADDTALEVDFLNGEPGVYSARYAGESAIFDDNINKLLKKMKNVPFEKRTAKFITIMALALSKDEIILSKGICEGYILEDKKGNFGFGYDSIFFLKNLNKTFAEMTLKEKNQFSHRALALKNMKSKASSFFNQ